MVVPQVSLASTSPPLALSSMLQPPARPLQEPSRPARGGALIAVCDPVGDAAPSGTGSDGLAVGTGAPSGTGAGCDCTGAGCGAAAAWRCCSVNAVRRLSS